MTLSRFILFLCLALAILLVRLPPSLLDWSLSQASGGRLRLASIEGAFWHGAGVLAIADDRGILVTQRPVGWRFGFAPARAAVTLQLSEGGVTQARVLFSLSAIHVERLSFDIPLELLAAATSHPAARAGWRGTLDFRSSGISCAWSGECAGATNIRWIDAGLDIIPERRLGNHDIAIQVLGDETNIMVSTRDGEFHIDGHGALRRQGEVSFEARITGDPEIVDRIPDIMDRNARRSGIPGQILVRFP